jgi:hypothetical protein
MSDHHTPEPWNCGNATGLRPTTPIYRQPYGLEDIAEVKHREDALCIVACINACAGVPTEILQAWLNPPDGQMGLPHGPWHRHLVALGAERARLGNLLERFLAIDDWTDDSIAPPELIAEAKAALAELEGLTIEAAA